MGRFIIYYSKTCSIQEDISNHITLTSPVSNYLSTQKNIQRLSGEVDDAACCNPADHDYFDPTWFRQFQLDWLKCYEFSLPNPQKN